MRVILIKLEKKPHYSRFENDQRREEGKVLVLFKKFAEEKRREIGLKTLGYIWPTNGIFRV